MSASISVKTRKRLWLKSGGVCAFPGCYRELLENASADEDTIVGIECHIVSQQDSTTVARSVSSLSQKDRHEYSHLISDRHGFANLVIMCANHSAIIDDPAGGYSVTDVAQMKRDHEASIARGRSDDEKLQDEIMLRYAEIVDGWAERVRLSEWGSWIGGIFGDGHPRMSVDDFKRLEATRRWIYLRVWPREFADLEDAFKNFQRVAQDMQLVFDAFPHEHLRNMGWIGPTRFYNDPMWQSSGITQSRLEELYGWVAYLLEDYALELTRAANVICELVRRRIDPRFRVDEGVIAFDSGPYMDMRFRVHRPEYAVESGSLPYEGFSEFVTKRGERDECRDKSPVPDELAGSLPF